jgi:hypothetical protein
LKAGSSVTKRKRDDGAVAQGNDLPDSRKLSNAYKL